MKTIAILALSLCVATPDVLARGGRGGGRGGANRQPSSTRSLQRQRQQRREEQKERNEEQRKLERLKSIEEARLLYAKRERQDDWNDQAARRMEDALRRILETTN